MNRERHLQSVLGALSIFGENTRAALLSELEKQGVSFDPDNFDIQKFCEVLEIMLDHWSDMIFIKIIEDICEQSGTSVEDLGLGGRAKFVKRSELFKDVYMKIKAKR
jgi:hypothetical protein